MSRSTVSAERGFAGYFAARILALWLVDSRTSSSAVWVDETVVLHVLRSFSTDLIFEVRTADEEREGTDEGMGERKTEEMIVAADLA